MLSLAIETTPLKTTHVFTFSPVLKRSIIEYIYVRFRVCVRLETVFFFAKKAMFLLHAVPELRVKGSIVRHILTFYASIGRYNNCLESQSDFGIIL